MDKKAGYIPGKGRTFTPSLTAKWIEEFNELLNGSGVSRNSLTEELIESGLKFKRNEHLLISTSSLTPEQIELLSSKQGQTILLNVALMLLGNPEGLRQINPLKANSIPVENSVNIQKESENYLIEVEARETKVQDKVDLIQSLPDRLISSQSKEDEEKILSPREKALLKMRSLNQSKGDLRKN